MVWREIIVFIRTHACILNSNGGCAARRNLGRSFMAFHIGAMSGIRSTARVTEVTRPGGSAMRAEGSDPEKRQCAQCGAAFECGAHGSEPCWCSHLPNVLPVRGAEEAGCLCPACLRAAIDAEQARRLTLRTTRSPSSSDV